MANPLGVESKASLGVNAANGNGFENSVPGNLHPQTNEHLGFDKLKDKLEDEGHGEDSAAAIAASIGRKKYGAEGMAQKAAAGRADNTQAAPSSNASSQPRHPSNGRFQGTASNAARLGFNEDWEDMANNASATPGGTDKGAPAQLLGDHGDGQAWPKRTVKLDEETDDGDNDVDALGGVKVDSHLGHDRPPLGGTKVDKTGTATRKMVGNDGATPPPTGNAGKANPMDFHASTKNAATASLQAEHPGPMKPALAAVGMSGKGDNQGAANAHNEAAAAHDAAAAQCIGNGDTAGAEMHSKAAMAHRQASALHAYHGNAAAQQPQAAQGAAQQGAPVGTPQPQPPGGMPGMTHQPEEDRNAMPNLPQQPMGQAAVPGIGKPPAAQQPPTQQAMPTQPTPPQGTLPAQQQQPAQLAFPGQQPPGQPPKPPQSAAGPAQPAAHPPAPAAPAPAMHPPMPPQQQPAAPPQAQKPMAPPMPPQQMPHQQRPQPQGQNCDMFTPQQTPAHNDATAAGEHHDAMMARMREDGDCDTCDYEDDDSPGTRNSATHNRRGTVNTLTTAALGRINKMTRNELLGTLVANCSCQATRNKVASLDDASLRLLLANSLRLADNTLTAVGDGSSSIQGGGEEDDKDDDTMGYKSDPGKGLEQGNEVGDSKVKAKDSPSMNMSAEDMEFRNIGREVVRQRRAGLINYITANQGQYGAAYVKQAQRYLSQKSMSELQFIANTIKAHRPAQPTHNGLEDAGAPLFVGNSGGTDFLGGSIDPTDNYAASEDDVLPMPTINYNDESEITQRGGKRRQA